MNDFSSSVAKAKAKMAKGDKKGSREKLYLRMIKKFAPKLGYTFSSRTDNRMTDFELVRK